MATSALLTPTLSVALGLSAAACVADPPVRRLTASERRANLLQERAAFDLQCPRPQLRTQQLGNEQTMGVAGCGRRAVYLYDYGRDAWVMNGAIDSEQAAGPGATDTKNPPSPARREDASGNPGGTTP
jgi:hypothetical protein